MRILSLLPLLVVVVFDSIIAGHATFINPALDILDLIFNCGRNVSFPSDRTFSAFAPMRVNNQLQFQLCHLCMVFMGRYIFYVSDHIFLRNGTYRFLRHLCKTHQHITRKLSYKIGLECKMF
jgi:hypothetical protein